MPAPVDSSDPFRALSDPKRRAILEVLSAGPLPVRLIAGHFPEISRPAVSKHLRMLLEGGLVWEERSGRERYYSIARESFREALDWMHGVDAQGVAPASRGGRTVARAESGSTGERGVPSAVPGSRPAAARRKPKARLKSAAHEAPSEERAAAIAPTEADSAPEDSAQDGGWKAW